jgi:hypothetical protein
VPPILEESKFQASQFHVPAEQAPSDGRAIPCARVENEHAQHARDSKKVLAHAFHFMRISLDQSPPLPTKFVSICVNS